MLFRIIVYNIGTLGTYEQLIKVTHVIKINKKKLNL